MKKILVWTLVLAMIFGLTACGSASQNSEEDSSAQTAETAETAETKGTEDAETSSDNILRIGVWEPLTGELAAGGEQDLEAYEFGVHMQSEVLGYDIELVVADNRSDRTEAANAVTRLIYDEEVDFILGSYGSSVTNGGADIIEEAGIPTIVNCSNLNVTQDRYWLCRLCYLDNYMGTILAEFATQDLECETCVIVRNTSEDYSVGIVSYLTEEFPARSGNPDGVLSVIDYTANDQDFSAIISSIQQLQPDCIFMPGFYSDVGLFASQLRAAGSDIPLISADGIMNNDFVDIAGDAAEGVYCNANFNIAAGEDNPLAQEFVEAWREYYDKDPTSDNAVCFANYCLLMDAIEAVGDVEDKEGIMEYMRNLTDYESLLGTVTMDPEIATPATRTGVIMQVQNGEFQYVKSVTPE